MVTQLYPRNQELPMRHGLAALASTLLFASMILFHNEEMAEFVLLVSPLPLSLLVNPLYKAQMEWAPTESQLARACGLLGVTSVVALSIIGLVATHIGPGGSGLGTGLLMMCLTMMCLSATWMAMTSWLMLHHPGGRRLVQLLGLIGVASSTCWFALLVSTIGYSVGNAGSDLIMVLAGANIVLLLLSFLIWTGGLAIALLIGVWL